MKIEGEILVVEYSIRGDKHTEFEKKVLTAHFQLRHLMGIAALIRLVDIQAGCNRDDITWQNLENLCVSINELGSLIYALADGAYGDVVELEELYNRQAKSFCEALDAAKSAEKGE